ncbi:MAG TPA: hypothetical protein VI729_10325 [Anaerolineales bacterium]|nr:hypothetical protein [Anaerolineales bacterium]
MANGTQTKAINAPAPPPPQRTLTRSVQQPPVSLEAGPGGGNAFVLWMASIADTFEAWGRNVVKRDMELREFWPTESFLAGAVFTCATSNASLEWELDGPDRTVEVVHELLNQADFGRGWREFAVKVSLDLYTQDNGAFIEIIRSANSPAAPILGISHLDSARCQRTGDLEFPVIYMDIKGTRHKMPWHSVIALAEFPAPITSMYGVQYSAVTRVLRSAQILRDMEIYRGEKAGGRFAEAIYALGGVKSQDIKDVQARMESQADNQGLVRYLGPLIVGSLDPGTQVSVAKLELKSLPEGFDFDQELKWYISSLALGFGRDYQDFAPLPAGNIGTGQQSEVLHLKARGKGPAAFMRMLEQSFNFHGVMPRTVTFRFKEQDIQAEQEEALVKKTRAETRKIQIESFEISPVIARQIAADDGDLKPEYLEVLGEGDVTPEETVEGGEKPTDDSEVGAIIVPPETEVPAEEKMLRATFTNFTRILSQNPQFKQRNPDVMMLLDQAAKEVTLDAKLDGLIRIVQELQSTGLQGTVDEALADSVQEIASKTDQTLQETVGSIQKMFAEGLKRFEAQMRSSVLENVGSEVRKARSDGLDELIDSRLDRSMRQIATDAEKALVQAGQSMREDLSVTAANMSEGLETQTRQINERLDQAVLSFEQENDERRQAITLAVSGLDKALRQIEKTQKAQKSVAELTAQAEAKAEQARLSAVVVKQEILKRDANGRAMLIRKHMASGETLDYDVIRGEDQLIEHLEIRK